MVFVFILLDILAYLPQNKIKLLRCVILVTKTKKILAMYAMFVSLGGIIIWWQERKPWYQVFCSHRIYTRSIVVKVKWCMCHAVRLSGCFVSECESQAMGTLHLRVWGGTCI